MPSTKAKKGDLALMPVREGSTTYINPPRHVPGRSGYCFAIVTSCNRDGLVKTAERNHETARWPWNLVGQEHSVGAAAKVGDVAACVRELPKVYDTPAGATEALKAWLASRGAKAAA